MEATTDAVCASPGGALTVNKGQIEPGDVYVTDYGHVIKDDRIAILDPVQKLAGLNYGKMRLFGYDLASVDDNSVKNYNIFLTAAVADSLHRPVQISNDYIFLVSTPNHTGRNLVEGLSHNG